MNFKVSSTMLYSRLSAASKVMASKNSMAILDSFLIEVKDGQMHITSSDSEKYFFTSIPLVEQSGDARFCITAKTLIESIKELAEQPLTLEYNPDTFHINGYHSCGTFGVMAQDAEPYPLPKPMAEPFHKTTIPAKHLLNGVSRCLFATGNDDMRPVMNGVYLDIEPERITFASTDGRKLVRNIMNDVKSDFKAGFILPKKVANVIRTMLTKDSPELEVVFNADKACIKNEEMTLFFSQVEGRYPNYNAPIPADTPYVATFDRQALASALKRINVFCNQSSGLMKFELGQNSVKLTGQDYDYATNAEEFLYCQYEGVPMHIGFNCQYMLEIATILDSESISICLTDPSRPGVIKPVSDNNDEDILMLLMPMQVEQL